VRGTPDDETGSETIDENGVVNCVECSMRSRERRRVASLLSAAW